VIGLGINILPRDAKGLATPPAWVQELASDWDAPRVLAQVVPPLVQQLQAFAHQGFAPLQRAFAARDVLQGREVTLSDGRAGRAQGVDERGALLVHTATGLEKISSAEVSVRPRA